MPSDRMPRLADEALTAAQKSAVAAFRELRGVDISGPFVPLLRSPELMARVQAVGEFLRYRNALGNPLSEFAILITARRWSQNTEWAIHQPIALKAGVSAEIAQAIEDGRRSESMSEDQALIYDFEAELERSKGVSDATYARAQKRFGEHGVIELTAIFGYYRLLAMVMNVARSEAPDGPRLKALPERA